ncbi:DUF3180 domain-containing protein [Dermacoccaceae bacterium W4C1]
MNEDGLRPKTVVQCLVAAAALCWIGLRFLVSRGQTLPQNSWLTLLVLIALAAPLLVMSRMIRGYVRGDRARLPFTPQTSRAVLVGAQAAAVAGAVAAGWYLAQVVIRWPRMEFGSQRDEVVVAAVLAVASVGLSAVGLVAQHWCRLPPQDRDEDSPGASPA